MLLKNKENKQGAFSVFTLSANCFLKHVTKMNCNSANTLHRDMRNISIESLTCLLLNEVSLTENKYSVINRIDSSEQFIITAINALFLIYKHIYYVFNNCILILY